MLVLSRKRLEQVLVGSNIRITIVKIDRNQVRLGIEAPDDVVILRGELVLGEEETLEGTSPALAAARD